MTELLKKPTHRCKRCNALWTVWPGDQGWSLFSLHCGSCCDNAAMGDQIEALPITGKKHFLLRDDVYEIMPFFEFQHLPQHLAKVSAPFGELAWLIANGPQNAETAMALRKLLEAKDCAVRAALVKH